MGDKNNAQMIGEIKRRGTSDILIVTPIVKMYGLERNKPYRVIFEEIER